MTNNIDRAAKILYDEGVGDGDAGYYYARRLADEKLLALTEDEQDKTIQTLSRLLAGTEEAATERAEQIGRVRNALNRIARVKADSEAALDHGYDNPEWHEATVDALEYVIDLLTEALEGETE